MPDPNSAYLKCPHCGEQDNHVLETRGSKRSRALRRRRLCQSCEKIFSTIEIPFDFIRHRLDRDIPTVDALMAYFDGKEDG